ncbi:MAG: nitroreductase [Proteobacteria bacterium]|nr:nitroreductase [Desulfobacula sp.]MBU3953862.1 nitroreductase [Pseudomonadota bacterium]MBU4132508.1 nitroreductase [Pseudomonadota bacterium]
MNRRIFLKKGMVTAGLLLGPVPLLPSCARNLRSELMVASPMPGGSTLSREAWQILHHASLAPSGHNTQPWVVEIVSETEWIIGSDAKRWLKVVDNTNREVLLSLGTFIENLVQAAAATGFHAQVDVVARDRFDTRIARVNLSRMAPADIPLNRLASRRTVKTNLLARELKLADVTAFSRATKGNLYYFPRGTRHCDLMEKEAIDNFKLQFDNQKAMEEAAIWTRLSDTEARKFRDGLTTDGMEINGISGWVVRHFMDKKDVTGTTFREKGIEKTMKQAGEGAGWLVITSDGTSVKDLIECGRRFQRMALLAREKMIAIHPMTQALEEKHGQKNIRENHKPEMMPQFILRVGYLEKYPDPVSLRRPVDWFLARSGTFL